jgi:hypothetical protein
MTMTDDKQVEQALRAAWDPQPPAALRERVLQAVPPARAAARRHTRWQLALAATVLGVCLGAQQADQRRAERLVTMTGWPTATVAESMPALLAGLRQRAQDLSRVSVPVALGFQEDGR